MWWLVQFHCCHVSCGNTTVPVPCCACACASPQVAAGRRRSLCKVACSIGPAWRARARGLFPSPTGTLSRKATNQAKRVYWGLGAALCCAVPLAFSSPRSTPHKSATRNVGTPFALARLAVVLPTTHHSSRLAARRPPHRPPLTQRTGHGGVAMGITGYHASPAPLPRARSHRTPCHMSASSPLLLVSSSPLLLFSSPPLLPRIALSSHVVRAARDGVRGRGARDEQRRVARVGEADEGDARRREGSSRRLLRISLRASLRRLLRLARGRGRRPRGGRQEEALRLGRHRLDLAHSLRDRRRRATDAARSRGGWGAGLVEPTRQRTRRERARRDGIGECRPTRRHHASSSRVTPRHHAAPSRVTPARPLAR